MYDKDGAWSVEDDQFEQVAGPVWACSEVAGWVVVELDPGEDMVEGVGDVLVGYAVAPGGSVDLHTQ